MGFSLKRLFGGGGDGGAGAKQQMMAEMLRALSMQQGTAAINSIFDGQFNDKFFDDRRQSALNYYQPQLDQQYGDALKQLEFALARSGGMQSSAAAQQRGDLERRYGTNRQLIADKANTYATGARNAVEGARANLLTMLRQSGDVQGTINNARTQMSSLGAPDSYSPLADLFTTTTSLANQQSALERANTYGGSTVANPRYKVFGGGNAVVNS